MVKLSNHFKIEFLQNLLKIYSPSGREKRLASYLSSIMNRIGYRSVRTDDAGNVIGTIGASGTGILLCGHMDTVAGEIPVQVRDGRIFGRGSVDAKSALAAIVLASSEIRDRLGNGRLIVAAVTREETDGKGIEGLMDSGIDADYAIFGEPTGLKRITVGYKGKIGARLCLKAMESGHTSAPWVYPNPIELSHEFIASVRRKIGKKGNPWKSVTVCLTRMSGGQSLNVTPKSCVSCLDVRIPVGSSTEAAKSSLQARLHDFCSTRKNIIGEMSFSGDSVEPYEVDPNHKVVRALARGILQTDGRPVQLIRKMGTSDLNVLHARTGIHGVSYGPGNPRLSHTDGEFVTRSEYLKTIRVYEKAMQYLVKV